MKIYINGHPLDIAERATVADALALFLNEQQQTLSFAVALNSDFVAKSHYQTKLLRAQDCLDVLFPIQGG